MEASENEDVSPSQSVLLPAQTVSEHEDLAADLRVKHAYLPAIWSDGAGRNPSARAFASRITANLRNPLREVKPQDVEWLTRYGEGLQRKRTTTIIEEEEIDFWGPDNPVKPQDFITLLVQTIVTLKRDTVAIIDKKDREHKDFTEKAFERSDNNNMEFVKLLQKTNEANLSIVQKAYQGGSEISTKLLNQMVPMMGTLLDGNIRLVNASSDMQDKAAKALLEYTNNASKPGNFELLIMLVLAPMLPVIVPAILQKMKIPIPEGFSGLLTKSIATVLGGVDKP